jgi:hypothetical protein
VPILVDSFSAHCEALTLNYLGGFPGFDDPNKITGGMQAGGAMRSAASIRVSGF